MIIEKNVDPIRVICESRRLKALMVITQAEFYFVAASQELSGDDKMIWLMLANESCADPNLYCVITYQNLGQLVGQSSRAVLDSIWRLHRMGYLTVNNEERPDAIGCKLKIPLDGLLKLKKTPKIRDFNNKEYIQALRAKNDPIRSKTLKTFAIVSCTSNGKSAKRKTQNVTQKPSDGNCPSSLSKNHVSNLISKHQLIRSQFMKIVKMIKRFVKLSKD